MRLRHPQLTPLCSALPAHLLSGKNLVTLAVKISATLTPLSSNDGQAGEVRISDRIDFAAGQL